MFVYYKAEEIYLDFGYYDIMELVGYFKLRFSIYIRIFVYYIIINIMIKCRS